MMSQSSIDQFLDRLASGDPTPGGGSAAAIMGAMGAALVSMVCNVSFGKKGYEAAEPELRDMLVRSEQLRRRLAAMVAEDVAAFAEDAGDVVERAVGVGLGGDFARGSGIAEGDAVFAL